MAAPVRLARALDVDVSPHPTTAARELLRAATQAMAAASAIEGTRSKSSWQSWRQCCVRVWAAREQGARAFERKGWPSLRGFCFSLCSQLVY